jgi:hypothetical protein
MPFDPAAGFSLDPDLALRERVRELERLVGANPGAQAGGGFDPGSIVVNGVGQATVFDLATINAQAGPSAVLRVPEPGGSSQAEFRNRRLMARVIQ